MTHRERVLKAVNHEVPDRIPIDLGGPNCTSIHVDELIEIGRYLGLDLEPPKVYDTFQMMGRTEGLVMDWLHSDVVMLENLITAWDYPNKDWKPWTTTMGHSVLVPGAFHVENDPEGKIHLYNTAGKEVAFMSSNGLYFDWVDSTSMSAEIHFTDPKKWKESIRLYRDEELRIMEKTARFLRDHTDYFVVGDFRKCIITTTSYNFAGHTMSDWLCILLTEEEYAKEIVQASAEKALENLKLYLQAVGPYINAILMSTHDYGTQRSEFYNPEIFKNILMPALKLVNDYTHHYGDIKTMIHSCGCVRGFIPYFIEAGVDILNPIQYRAARMDLKELKDTFGDKLVFWGGGLDTQHTLPFGHKEEIIEEVKNNIRILGRNGGAVFALTHNMQMGVPPENVEAMLNAVLEWGTYSTDGSVAVDRNKQNDNKGYIQGYL
jgi:uroporphyrinogen decarboxylase